MVPVEDRSKDTLLPLIQETTAAGTPIVSDCWRAYDCLDDSGYQHLKVNHSINFVDPVTKANTQKIERLWRDLKDSIPHFGQRKEHYDGYLAHFAFLRKHKPHTVCLHFFFAAMADIPEEQVI